MKIPVLFRAGVNKVYVHNANGLVPTGQRVIWTILFSFVEDRLFSEWYPI